MYIRFKLFIKILFYHKPIIWPILETIQGLIYSLKYFYYYKLLKGTSGMSVKEVNIEFSSQCNLRCQFCSLDHFKPKHLISPEILEKFLNGFIIDKRYQSIKRINLYNGGEVLLHPKRIEMLQIIKKYKDLAQQKNKHFPEIHMLTNLVLLREKLAEQIIDIDVVDLLGISFDGGNPEAFEEMRTNAKWNIFYANAKAFDRIRKEKKSTVKMSAISCIPSDKSRSLKWMHPEFQEIYNLLDWYELRRLHNWAGDIDTVQVPEKKHKIGCSLLMEQMVLLPNGDVTICCNDLNSKAVIGNILKTDFMDIYNCEQRVQYLKLHLQGKKDQIDLCKACETF
ncbi:MAG: radical SAM/SPASM domain-containing protein [Vicingaceae bacterium]